MQLIGPGHAAADYRINELVLKSMLHIFVHTYMRLAVVIVNHPGTEFVYIAVIIAQYLFHSADVTGAGGLDFLKAAVEDVNCS